MSNEDYHPSCTSTGSVLPLCDFDENPSHCLGEVTLTKSLLNVMMDTL